MIAFLLTFSAYIFVNSESLHLEKQFHRSTIHYLCLICILIYRFNYLRDLVEYLSTFLQIYSSLLVSLLHIFDNPLID